MKFCDLECRWASFPKTNDVDGSRSCRTFVALYCALRKALVHKNAPCADKDETPLKAAKATPRKKSSTGKAASKKTSKKMRG